MIEDQPTGSVAAAQQRLLAALAGLRAGIGPSCSAEELVSTLVLCEAVGRQLDQLSISVLATIERQGLFGELGYPSSAGAVGDLLRCDWSEAGRRTLVAASVQATVGLDGEVRPPRLPATATAFEDGTAGLRHVEVIATLLDSPAAKRLTAQAWAGAEQELAAKAGEYTPSQLRTWGRRLIDMLDQDAARTRRRRGPAGSADQRAAPDPLPA